MCTVTGLFSRISSFNKTLFQNHRVLKCALTVSCSNQNFLLCNEFQFSIPHRHSSIATAVLAEKSTQLPKRIVSKKKIVEEIDDSFPVAAFSTAKEYNLSKILETLPKATDFVPSKFNENFQKVTKCVHLVNSCVNSNERRDLFFFREGSVVMWNIPYLERKKILDFLRFHENNSFKDEIVENESEIMNYSYCADRTKTGIFEGTLKFASDCNLELEKYAVSNAMALSVHLGTYEANLDEYIESMAPVTEDLKIGAEIKMSRDEVLRKTGQLFDLKHKINLSSDLLDTPDFYWDREELENLYQTTFNYFCINKRTKVMNEKINHCLELVQLLSSHLNDKHHIRLEWMIIILIMVEVAFEIIHYVERYI